MNRILLLLLVVLSFDSARGQTVEPQPTKKAAARAKQLKAAIDGFELTFSSGLVFSVARRTEKDDAWRTVHIDRSQASLIIEHLMLSGFLDQASDFKVFHEKHPAENPCIIMLVVAEHGEMPHGSLMIFEENLGWGFQMYKRLKGLRKVLKGNAGEEMDWLLKDLEKHNAEWKKEPDPFSRVKVSANGWDLRIWEERDTAYFSLLPALEERDTEHTNQEVLKAAVKGFKAIKPQLKELRSGQMVHIYGRKYPDKQPQTQLALVLKYCKELGLETWVIPDYGRKAGRGR